MPKRGFYAVRVGKKIGVYNTWDECRDQTKGYPNARYKRFDTLKEAEEFVNGKISSAPLPQQDPNSDAGCVSASNGKKRAYAEIEDESGWDVVYTDGACKGNGCFGSVAGVGVWWGHGDPRNIAERCPGDQANNRAELVAILRVLETTPLSKRPLLIKTDSQYSIDCFEVWIHNWKRNNWKAATGKAVKNENIIRCIGLHLDIRSKSGQRVRLQYVKGHSGESGNEGADSLANQGTLKPPVQERDWQWLETKLVEGLDGIDPNTASSALVEVQSSIDTAKPISLELPPKSRKLDVVPSHNQLDRDIASNLKANSSTPNPERAVVQAPGTSATNPYYDVTAKLRSGQEQSWTWLDKLTSSPFKAKSSNSSTTLTEDRKAAEKDILVSSIQVPSDVAANSRLGGNTKKPLAVVELQKVDRVPPLDANLTPEKLSDVFGEARSTEMSTRSHQSTAQSLQGSSKTTDQRFHADALTRSPLRVLYAAPPLVPVAMEDVNFEDYADCLVDDADLALELSD